MWSDEIDKNNEIEDRIAKKQEKKWENPVLQKYWEETKEQREKTHTAKLLENKGFE